MEDTDKKEEVDGEARALANDTLSEWETAKASTGLRPRAPPLAVNTRLLKMFKFSLRAVNAAVRGNIHVDILPRIR